MGDTARQIQFTVPGAAVPKDRARARIVQPPGQRPFIQHYTSKETVKFEERVAKRAAIAMAGKTAFTRPCELQVTIWVAIPDSWPKWKQEAAQKQDIAPTSTPDSDNVLKSISDAMNAIVYNDDAQVFQTQVMKLYATDGRGPRTLVSVRENWRCPHNITRKDQLEFPA
jgi:Holliday junction resolvase RusA-like endonuclease